MLIVNALHRCVGKGERQREYPESPCCFSLAAVIHCRCLPLVLAFGSTILHAGVSCTLLVLVLVLVLLSNYRPSCHGFLTFL